MFDAQNNFTGIIPRTDPNDPQRPFALHPDTLFSKNSPESRAALEVWLSKLLSSKPDQRCQAISELPGEGSDGENGAPEGGPLELLIEMAQFEVIKDALPQVAQAAALEQLEWNCYPVPEGERETQSKATPLSFDLRAGTFKEGTGYLEPTAVTIAAAAAAVTGIAQIEGEQPPHGITPKQTPLGLFFENDFSLATTNLLKNLPPSILFAIFVQAARVLTRCTLTALGAAGEAIENKAAFKYLVDWPLGILYRYAQFWRSTPGEERYRRITIWAVSVTLLLVGIGARNSVSVFWAAVLILVPAAVLLLMCLLGEVFGMKWRWMLVVALLLVLVVVSWGFVPHPAWIAGLTKPPEAKWHATLRAIPRLAIVAALGFAIGVTLDLVNFLRRWWADRRKPRNAATSPTEVEAPPPSSQAQAPGS